MGVVASRPDGKPAGVELRAASTNNTQKQRNIMALRTVAT